MNNCNYSILLFLMLCFCSLTAKENKVFDGLFGSERQAFRYEIDAIEFEGNNSFPPEILFRAISSKRNSISPQHKQILFFKQQFEINNSTPKSLDSVVDKSLDNLEHEISYFSENTAETDSMSLWNFYNINGFHFAEIYFTFKPDSTEGKNVLTFHIKENQRFKLKTVAVIGLDSLPDNISNTLVERKNWGEGGYFAEERIIREVSRVQNKLLNSGYYYSKYKKPKVTMDTTAGTDSVTVFFEIGKRQKIGSIKFIDTRNGQKIVARDMKRKQLDFDVGQWYSRNKIRNTENNFNSLGLFYSVSIDTNSTYHPITDTTLSFVIDLQYSKQLDYGGAYFLNQTTLDNFWNTGFETSISHSNLLGAAQHVTLFGNFSLRNIGVILNKFENIFTEVQIEGQAGVRYKQPLMWTIDNSRIGFSSSFVFTASTLNEFRLNTWSMPIQFPTRFPRNTYFNNANFELLFERQEPINYEATVERIVGSENESNLQTLEALIYYSDLDLFLKDRRNLLTSNLIGLSVVGDSRDNPFNPTDGSYSYIGVDGWNIFLAHQAFEGLAKFFRFQLTRTDYFSLNKLAVHATKIKVGGIRLVDRNQTYVPINRQFFAGGSNSVRGWQARKLHYSDLRPDSSFTQENFDFISNLVGSGALIEASYEFRYKFHKPDDINETVAEQISKIGFAYFLDIGNAFNWYADNTTKTEFSDYFTKLAWASGVGIRYDTPIGPVRLDIALPIYGPVFGKDDRIWRRENILSDYSIHLGIGHAF